MIYRYSSYHKYEHERTSNFCTYPHAAPSCASIGPWHQIIMTSLKLSRFFHSIGKSRATVVATASMVVFSRICSLVCVSQEFFESRRQAGFAYSSECLPRPRMLASHPDSHCSFCGFHHGLQPKAFCQSMWEGSLKST